MMETDQLYQTYKPLLFSLAYRMLGSVMDAEDIVHDVFADWERMQSQNNKEVQEIRQIKSYLCKMVTNRCIDRLRSAKVQREQYVGTWLPEPMVAYVQTNTVERDATHGEGDPLHRALRSDSISVAYLIMLETLSPTERAVFLLREVFEYDYEDIAEVISKKPENCRQIIRRAKKKISTYDSSSPSVWRRTAKHDSARQTILTQFVRNVTEGNIDALMNMITDQAVFISDGGGKVHAAIYPVVGKNRITRFILGLASKMDPDLFTIEFAEVNGEPGLVIFAGETPYCTMAFTYGEGHISTIYNTMNPDKLLHVRRP